MRRAYVCVEKVLVYLFVICVATGFINNIFGAVPLICILLVLAILRGKFRARVIISVATVLLFILIKSLELDNYVAYSDYHSIYKIIKNVIYVGVGIILFEVSGIKKHFHDVKLRRVFYGCYYFSIISSCILIMIKGRDLYRDHAEDGGLLLTPQYFLYYAISFAMLYTYLIIKSKEHRRLNVFFLIINVVYVFLANYTTQMLFMAMGVALIIMTHLIKSYIAICMILIICILALGIFSEQVAQGILLISESFFENNETVSIRVNDVAMIIKGEASSTTAFKIRSDLISKSLDVFKQNILWGINFSDYNTSDIGVTVGGHTQWFDDLARFGMVGCLLWWYTLWIGYKHVIVGGGKCTEFQKNFLIVFFAYGFFNPFITIQFICIAYIIVQMEKMYMKDKEKWAEVA